MSMEKTPKQTLAPAEKGREQNLGKKEKARLGNLASKLFEEIHFTPVLQSGYEIRRAVA